VGLSGGGEGGDRVPEPIQPPGRLPSGARAVEGKPFDRPGGEARGAGRPPRVGVAAGHRAPGKWSEKSEKSEKKTARNFFDAAGPGGGLHWNYPALGLAGATRRAFGQARSTSSPPLPGVGPAGWASLEPPGAGPGPGLAVLTGPGYRVS